MIDFKRSNLPIKFLGGLIFILLIIILSWLLFPKVRLISQKQKELMNQQEIILPQPSKRSETSIEETLSERRSVREYKDEPLTLQEISQILWAAQGITAPLRGGRTAPSAGALYPLEVYLIARKVDGVEPGVYRYLPEGHKLNRVLEGDVSDSLCGAALRQASIREAPVNLVIGALYERTTRKYGERGIRYVHLEAGHAAQNIYLQVQSLGLGTVVIGAFDDEEVKEVLNLPEEEIPLYIIPVGKIVVAK